MGEKIPCVAMNSADTNIRRGRISLDQQNILVTFPYNKTRFAGIKRFAGSRYDKERKCWVLPLSALAALKKSRQFSPKSMNYLFSDEEAVQAFGNWQREFAQVWAELAQNPFCVTEELIAKADPDLVFRRGDKHNGVLVTTKTRSRARELLEAVPGVHWVGREKALAFPVMHLKSFLRELKSEEISFAVEESLGRQLANTAAIRQRLLSDPSSLSAHELYQALVFPYLALNNKNAKQTFRLVGASSEELRELFLRIPEGCSRRDASSFMSKEGVIELIYRASATSTRIWRSKEVEQSLLRVKEKCRLAIEQNAPASVPDHYLFLAQPDCFWLISSLGRGGLLIRKELRKQISDARFSALLKMEDAEESIQFPGFLAYWKRDSQLLEFYESVSLLWEEVQVENTGAELDKVPGTSFPGTSATCSCSQTLPKPVPGTSFSALLDDLRERAALLKRKKYFQSLNDCNLKLVDSELAQKLFPHQRVAVLWARETPMGLLGDDMGLGKTLSVLAAFIDQRSRGLVDFLLVVCPNSLTHNWQREAQQWLPDLKVSILEGQKKTKIDFLESLLAEEITQKLDCLIVNYEALRLDYVHPKIGEYLKTRRPLLVVDESQRAKNPQSQIFSALLSIAEACNRRLLLSGTPTPRDLADIWAQFRILDSGKRFGTNYYQWLETVAEIGNEWSDYAVERYKPAEVSEAALRVQEILLRRKKEEVISLPEKLFSFRDVELTGTQKQRYEEVRKQLLLRVTAADGEEFVREINSILEEYLRAVQAASNPRLIDPLWQGEPAKFLELDTIVEELVRENSQSLVVWTNYLDNVSELTKRYEDLGSAEISGRVSNVQRSKIVKAFQAKEIKILVAVPAAGGVGLTLTAAQTAVYVDKTWNAEHWMQSIDRIHRIGQRGTVSIISLHACPVDRLIHKNLNRKVRQQEELLAHNRGVVSTEEFAIPSRQELIKSLSRK